MLKLAFVLCFLCFNGIALGGNFNVMDHGAKADEKTDDAKVCYFFFFFFKNSINISCMFFGFSDDIYVVD